MMNKKGYTFSALSLLFITIALFQNFSRDPSNDYSTKIFAGYQAWFSTPGGTCLNAWRHWFKRNNDIPENVTFDLWPDTSEYPKGSLKETSLTLRNGKKAQLFDSCHEGVVDLHFKWMKDYGIDGVAVQRFLTSVVDNRYQDKLPFIRNLARSARKYNRKFYMMYDLTNFNKHIQNKDWEDTIKADWEKLEKEINFANNYAHENGKPLIALWGLGFQYGNVKSWYPGDKNKIIRVVNWFKRKGYFVIGGVPYVWRTYQNTHRDYKEVVQSLDAIEPWSVGRYRTPQTAKAQLGHKRADLALVNQRNQKYKHVIFPGFSWKNLNNGKRNSIPRVGGRFFWSQATTARKAGGQGVYIAMFDEFDEGTAIMKAAVREDQVPPIPGFLTLGADNIRMESDFYLWLSGEVTKMVTGKIALNEQVPRRSSRPTPNPAPAPRPTPTPAPVPTPNPSPGQSDKYNKFVSEVLYQGLLSRAADTGGLRAWSNHLRSRRFSCQQIAAPFLKGVRFLVGRKNNSEFVNLLYQGLLRRKADSRGYNFYYNRLQRTPSGRNAVMRETIVKEISNGNEFRNVCRSYGL